MQRGWVESMQRGGDLAEGGREAVREGGQAAEGGDSVEPGQGRRAGSPVHQHECAADADVGSAREPDRGRGETLPGDLPLEHRLLGGQGRVRHDPQDQRVQRRRDIGQPHQAHRGPEAAGEGLWRARKLGALEAGLSPQQLDQPADLPPLNHHGIYRNCVFRYCLGP